mmetsp:Transcript_745/g.1934  ORF Transcript_745/g.1934 Transcript_745/m.1934 type:complete len:161 (+) Transcript_745:272-754(+)
MSESKDKKNIETPELTPELQERIRRNRERALQIQAERKRKAAAATTSTASNEEESSSRKLPKTEEECEDWEIGLSEWVSKKEAVTKYCLPEGTLAVCETKEKDNPRHKGWASMKLYRRSELRARAYKRHGGKEGLIKERNKREQKRLEKDLKAAEKVFEK